MQIMYAHLVGSATIHHDGIIDLMGITNTVRCESYPGVASVSLIACVQYGHADEETESWLKIERLDEDGKAIDTRLLEIDFPAFTGVNGYSIIDYGFDFEATQDYDFSLAIGVSGCNILTIPLLVRCS